MLRPLLLAAAMPCLSHLHVHMAVRKLQVMLHLVK